MTPHLNFCRMHAPGMCEVNQWCNYWWIATYDSP